jgi:predicted nucleic acid-binding protein
MPFLNLPDDWHLELGVMGQTLRSNGFKPYLSDLMIGLVSIHHRAILLSNDKDFHPYTDLFGLKIE